MRVRLVEVDQQLADGILRALRQADYAVDWMADGEIADGVLETENFDLIILDLTLPRLDGFEIVKRLRNRGSHVSVLILTARCDIENHVSGLDLGADDYLLKPFALSELEARLHALAIAERVVVIDGEIAGSTADGSGLGLAIVREIAEAHGGSVTLHSGKNGRGLRVRVSVPAAA